MGDAHEHRQNLPRRVGSLVLAALATLAVSGCVSVDSTAPAPKPRPSVAPAALRPAVLAVEEPQPSARTALVDTGTRHPRKRHTGPVHHDQKQPTGQGHPAPAVEAPAPQQPRHPAAAPKHRQPAPQPKRRADRPNAAASYDMRSLCRAAADHQVNAGIVDLCQDTYGH